MIQGCPTLNVFSYIHLHTIKTPEMEKSLYSRTWMVQNFNADTCMPLTQDCLPLLTDWTLQ